MIWHYGQAPSLGTNPTYLGEPCQCESGSGGNGGVVEVESMINEERGHSIKVTLQGLTFVNGKSMLARDPSGNELVYGGALTILGGEVELVDCTFRDNVLGTDGGSFMSSPYYGGAIHATGGHVTMKRCTFLRCVSRKKMHATLLCGCDMPFLLICALAFADSQEYWRRLWRGTCHCWCHCNHGGVLVH